MCNIALSFTGLPMTVNSSNLGYSAPYCPTVQLFDFSPLCVFTSLNCTWQWVEGKAGLVLHIAPTVRHLLPLAQISPYKYTLMRRRTQIKRTMMNMMMWMVSSEWWIYRGQLGPRKFLKIQIRSFVTEESRWQNICDFCILSFFNPWFIHQPLPPLQPVSPTSIWLPTVSPVSLIFLF